MRMTALNRLCYSSTRSPCHSAHHRKSLLRKPPGMQADGPERSQMNPGICNSQFRTEAIGRKVYTIWICPHAYALTRQTPVPVDIAQ